MDQKTQNAKSAIAMESILRDIERLAAAAGVSEQALENMRRPYGRGADRRVNQTHHAAHVLNLSVVALLGPVAEPEPVPPVDGDGLVGDETVAGETADGETVADGEVATTETETGEDATTDPAVTLPATDDATEPAPVPESARRRKGR